MLTIGFVVFEGQRPIAIGHLNDSDDPKRSCENNKINIVLFCRYIMDVNHKHATKEIHQFKSESWMLELLSRMETFGLSKLIPIITKRQEKEDRDDRMYT